MQPIVVRHGSKGVSTRFELIAGERRWRAAKHLGLTEIPAVIRQVGDQTAAEWALIENIQREDLNPIERSEAIGRLVEEFSLTHQSLAERLGLDRVTITNLLRLADLDPFTKEAVRKGVLSQGHAKVLLGVSQPERRKALASAAISSGLSVRELERRVREFDSPKSAPQTGQAAILTTKPHIADLERRLSEHLGTKVTIRENPKNKGSGHVIIDYYSIAQFDGLMAKVGFQSEL
jgi:ParB family chromosome partitioning protein